MKSELKHELIHVQKCKGIPMNPIEDSFNNFRLKNVTNDEIEASRKRVFKFLMEFNYIK